MKYCSRENYLGNLTTLVTSDCVKSRAAIGRASGEDVRGGSGAAAAAATGTGFGCWSRAFLGPRAGP